MITKRFLVEKSVAEPYIKADEALNEEFLAAIRSLSPGSTPSAYADAHHRIVTDFSEKQDKTRGAIILDRGLAPAMSSQEVGIISFDNFLGWDIEVIIASMRMFIEVRCVHMDKFPFASIPSWLTEIDYDEFKVLSGVKS